MFNRSKTTFEKPEAVSHPTPDEYVLKYEDTVTNGFIKVTSESLKDVINNALLSKSPAADEALWYRLIYPLHDDIVHIRNAVCSLEQNRLKITTAREYFVLGNIYQFYVNDFSLAFQNFKKAEQMGDVGALNNLGLMYLDGIGVKNNKDLAIKYFEQAADKNNTLAKINLYHDHRGNKKYAEAKKLITDTALPVNEKLSHHALYLLSTDLENEIENIMGRHSYSEMGMQLSKSLSDKLESILRESARLGNFFALANLASIYYNRACKLNGTVHDIVRCIKYSQLVLPYKYYLDQNPMPEALLGEIYFNGKKGIKKNYSIAANHYKSLVNMGYNNYYVHLGQIYSVNELITENNITLAAYFYFKAWESGNLSREILIHNLILLFNKSKYKDHRDVSFYLGLVLSADGLLMCMGDNPDLRDNSLNNFGIQLTDNFYSLLDKEIQLMTVQKTDANEYYFDQLAMENLHYLMKKMNIKDNALHRKVMRRVTDLSQQIARGIDNVVNSHIGQDPVSIVNAYLFGEEVYKAKQYFISFFSSQSTKIHSASSHEASKRNITTSQFCVIS